REGLIQVGRRFHRVGPIDQLHHPYGRELLRQVTPVAAPAAASNLPMKSAYVGFVRRVETGPLITAAPTPVRDQLNLVGVRVSQDYVEVGKAKQGKENGEQRQRAGSDLPWEGAGEGPHQAQAGGGNEHQRGC